MSVIDLRQARMKAIRLAKLEAVAAAALELLRAGATGQGIEFHHAYAELKRKVNELRALPDRPSPPSSA